MLQWNKRNEKGETSLHRACIDGNLKQVQYLVEQVRKTKRKKAKFKGVQTKKAGESLLSYESFIRADEIKVYIQKLKSDILDCVIINVLLLVSVSGSSSEPQRLLWVDSPA